MFDSDIGHSDPFAKVDSFSRLSGPKFTRYGRQELYRAQYRQTLPEDESQSLNTQVLSVGTSGISHVLGALDKPGQAVRGVLAGKGLSSLKHLVPFSDTMGLTTEKDHTSGRDLTNQIGLTDRKDNGWGAWGAGLAADIATDPFSYATFGAKHALTPTGRAVQKTGALRGFTGKQMLQGFQATEPALLQAGKRASDIEHLVDKGHRIAQAAAAATGVQANQPLACLVRIGIPFTENGVNIGTGRTAQRIAGEADKIGDYARFGNPVGRAVGSLFDHSVHGAVDSLTQRGAQRYLDPALTDLRAQARDDRFGVISHLDPAVSATPDAERAINDAARALAENVPHRFDPGTVAAAQPAANAIQRIGQRQLGEAQAAGASVKDVADQFAQYVHRSAFPEHPSTLQMSGQGSRPQGLLPTTSGSNIGRDELFRDIPGGTNRLNDWFDRFAGTSDKDAIERAIKKDLVGDLIAGGGKIDKATGKAFDAKAAALAARLKFANPAYRTTADQAGKPFFSPDLVSDVTQRGAQHAKTVANVKAAIGIMTDAARRRTQGDGLIPLHVVAKKLGLATQAADPVALTPIQGALVQIYRGLAKHGAGKVDPFLMGKRQALAKAVNEFGITPEHFEQLTKAYGAWKAPEQIQSSLGAFDSATNAFKALAYPIWLPSHVRNAATAFVNNMRHGVGLGDYASQLQAMTGRGARDLSAIHPSLAGLSPEAQVEQLRRLQYGSGNIFGGNGMNEEIAGNVKDAVDQGLRFTPQVPGSDRVGQTGSLIGDTADLALKQGLLGSLTATGRALSQGTAGLFNPLRQWGQAAGEHLGIRGVGGAAKDALPAVAAGRKIGTNVEDFFRGALWNKLAREGYSPGQAASQVDALHFNYENLTPFEKNVMRRVMPFYTYARKNLPLQLDTAIHTPGILQAQSKPFNQEGPDGKGYVPKYMDSGFSIPLGPEQNGQRQYISKLGLPAEEAFEKMHFRGGLPDVRRTALSYLGGMNPLVKAPLEQLFNTQFHTQRQLSDLRAPAAASAIGRLFGDDNPQLLSQILANSPVTRFVSSADKLLDPRKSLAQKTLNLATGVKVTDVDVDKQRAIDTRAALEEILRQHPSLSRYSSFYVKPEDVGKLTPEELALMQLYSTQQQAAREYAKAKRIGVKH